MTLDDRARRAALALRERTNEVDADAVLSRIERRGRRWRWTWPVAGVATAVAVVVAIAMVVPSLPRPAIDQVLPDPLQQPDPAPDPAAALPAGWDRIDLGRGALFDVAAGPAGLVAVGAIDGAPGAFRSTDGRDWTPVTEAFGDAESVLGVTADGDGYVAVGEVARGPALWTSSDGESWQQATLDAPDSGSLIGVTSGHGHRIAVGYTPVDGRAEPLLLSPTDDGSTWARGDEVTVDPATAEGGGDAGVTLTGVVATSDGFVATGTSADQPTVWRSPDGVAWSGSSLRDLGTAVPAEIPRPAEVGGRAHLLGATGEEGRTSGGIWADSGDGSWTPATGDVAEPTGQVVEHAVAAEDHHLAVGYRSDDGTMRPAAWSSPGDGAWTTVDGGDAFAASGWIASVIRLGEGIVAVGGDQDGLAYVWTYRAGDGEAPDQETDDEPASGEGSAAPDSDEGSEESEPDEADGSCSAADRSGPAPSEQTDLPAEVQRTRDELIAAAGACDLDALAALADPRRFTYSFGDNDDPVGSWRRAEDAGDRPLWYLVELLDQPSTTFEELPEDDPATRMHVWPIAAGSGDEEGWQDLVDAGIATDEDLAAWRAYGGYTGYRVGIADDGSWRFFVAGD